MNINVDLSFLRNWQKEFFKKAKRFNVLVVHRRAWKTTVSISYVLYKALQSKGFYWYISPTYKQSKAIAWDILKKFAREIPQTVINESELQITLFNGSKIRLFWADNPDSLRWLDLRWVIFDEYAQQPHVIYSEIVFPMINANNWWVIWIWTPKGRNAFHRLYQKSLTDEKYHWILLKASDSKLLTEEQIDQARQEMTDDEYNQEYECSFDAAIKWAYYRKEIEQARNEWRFKAWLFDPILDVYTVWDLWMSDYMAILFIQINGNEIRIIDSIQHNWEGFQYYKAELDKKPYNYTAHYFPHDIEVRELSTWASRLETVRDLFWSDKVYILPKLQVIDWINAVRRCFNNVWIDEKNIDLIEALTNYRQKLDEKRDVFLNRPEHDEYSHLADAMRYTAIAYEQLVKPRVDINLNIDFSDLV